MRTQSEVVVVGAGPAGIASALSLKDSGITPLVLEQSDRVAPSWRGRYDRLALNTWRRFSRLPGRPYPKGTPTFPTRDQMVAYLEEHAREEGIELELGTKVERIEREGGEWVVQTSRGEVRSPEVIVATGHENRPFIPAWEGREEFQGEILHAADYRNPGPFEGRSVLVVGAGSSGMEIAHDLADGGAEQVWMAVRRPPNIVLRQGPGSVPGDAIATALWHLPTRVADAIARFGRRMDFGDLSEHGLPVPEEGVFTQARRYGRVPSIMYEEVIEAIKEGRIEVVAAVEALDRGGVHLADGSRLEPDAVIAATGYRRALEPLVGHLGVLGERGVPKSIGVEPAAEGLRFIGYVPRPGGIGYMGKEARRAAKAIKRELGRNGLRRRQAEPTAAASS